jgi:replicative DNA helicase
MKTEERLSGALQENVLTLLVHSDTACKIIRGAVSPNLFESAVFREVAKHAIDFIDQFGEAIKDHLADSLDDILRGDDKRKATSFQRLLENLYEAKDSVNTEYVVSQLHKFVRQQNLKSAVVLAVEALEDGRIDAAEVELQKGLTSQVSVFEKGMTFSDPMQSLSFLDQIEQPMLTGIGELDRRGVGPNRKEQFVIMAPAGMGKTWGLIQLGKWALLQRYSVLHITLEMSERRVAQRYIQALFAVSKKDARVRLPSFRKDESGAMEDLFYEEVEQLCLTDPHIKAKLSTRITREFSRRPPLIIKEFPTSMLTVPMFESYLDGLERFHKFVPDMVIIDYPDLFALDASDLRVSIGNVNKQLRGVAVKRNHAQVIASQSNREGAKARIVDSTHAAEDYSKIATADVVMTYSQTLQEKRLGLARLFVPKARNDEDKFVALITQSYPIGQFALDSAHMGNEDYWEFLAGGNGHGKDDD